MYRNYIAIFCICLVLVSCGKKGYLFTSFHEPANDGLRILYSYDGFAWTDFNKTFLQPQVGSQRVMRDPSMVQGPDGVFHLVWTSSWRGDKGFGYASSGDLLHWSEEKLVPVMKEEAGTVNVWAPELFYDAAEKKYMIIWASCIPGRFEKGLEEDSNNHRLYVTTTKDFITFSPAALFFDAGFSVIDAVIVKRAVDDYVLVLKDNTRPERDIKVAFASRAMGPYTNVSKAFTDNFTEGPSVVKIKDEWLIYYDAYRKKTYDAVATGDFIHFSDVSSKITLPQGHKHGTIVTVKRKLIKQLLNSK